MKNMKKVVASVLAFSIVISSVQTTSFAESPECSGDNINIECLLKNGVEKKIAKKILPDLQDLEKANVLTNITGIDITAPIIARIINKAVPQEKKGLFEKLTSFVAKNSFASVFIFSFVYGKINNYYKKIVTKVKAGKVETAIDPVSTIKLLDTMMSSVKGQEKAKKQIRSAVLNIVDRNAQYTANPNKKSKKAGPGASVIYMVGPSGVGKSFSAEIMRKILSGFGAEPFVLEASDVDRKSRTSETEQLFGMREKQVKGGTIMEYSPVITRIKAIPNSVVIINEYDKMHTPELDEKLRTIMDQGYINVNGEKIDCSAATFIITSNESTGSVKKGNLEKDEKDDGTGSRTFINHDKAFLNRVKLIEFDNLSAPEYKGIAAVPFTDLAVRYLQQYKIDIDLNGTVDEVSQKVAELNKGARPIFDYVEKLNDKLLNEVVLNNVGNNGEPVHYKVSFDKNTEEFNLERVENKEKDKEPEAEKVHLLDLIKHNQESKPQIETKNN